MVANTLAIGRDTVYLEFGISCSSFWVTEERDDRGPESVPIVVVLGAVVVGELDQAVVVRQAGVRLPETPRPTVAEKKGGGGRKYIYGGNHITCLST